MPTTPLTEGQYDIVLSGGYRAREYVIVCPSTVIFAARVNGTPAADVFTQIIYDTVTTGAYTDINIGQVVLVSHTNDIRAAFFRGRVRLAPTSSVLYINQTSDAIVDNDYVFICDSYDITEVLEHDGKPFHQIPPMIKSADEDHPLQAAYAVLTDEATATFDLSVVMQVLTKDAAEGTYQWFIPDATYTVGTDTDPTITIEVDTPYNGWARLEYEDTEGTPNWYAFTLTAGDPNNPAHDFFRLCHEPVDYSADENGYTASVSYWDGVDDLLDQTRVAIVVDERYNDGDAEFSTIRFVGYFSDDTGDVRGDEKFGQLKNATINLAGFSQLAGEINFDAIAITHDTTPTAWNEINVPTPARAAAHVITGFSTLGNLAPFDWGVIDDTYSAGNMDTEDSSVMDAAQKLGQKINASFMQDGGGQFVFQRNANFQTASERDALDFVTPEPITLGEGLSFTLKHTHRRNVSAVNVSYTMYKASTGEQITIAARAPANGSGPGPMKSDIPPQILAPQDDLEDALEEARQRAGHWLEYLNPVDTLTVNIDDGYGFISPALHQWYTFDIPAADLPRGVAIATTDRWLCISISPRLNSRGGRDIQAVFRRESTGGKANIRASVTPAVTDTSLEVMPSYPSYGGEWVPAPSINYDTVDPDVQQPFDADDMSQTLPLPAEQGAGNSMPPPGWYKMRPAVNFKNPSNVETDWLTTLGAPYLLKFRGFAGIQTPDSACADEENFSVGTVIDHVGDVFTVEAFFTGSVYRIIWGENVDGALCCNLASYLETSGVITSTTVIDCAGNVIQIFSDLPSDVRYFLLDSVGPFTVELTMSGGSSGGEYDLYGDAFYQGAPDPDNPGGWINIARRDGVYIDNAPIDVAPPPYNSNHEYDVSLADFNAGVGGTGNVINIRYQDDDSYNDNQNLDLETFISGEGAGA
jgi:hypothetical protein